MSLDPAPTSSRPARVDPDLLVHPVRLRIVSEFGGRDRTTQQLAHALADVPAATLYRHVRGLREAGVLEVVDERSVRGATERTLRVAAGADRLDPDDLGHATRDELLGWVRTFVASLVDTVAAELDHTDPASLLDGGFSANRVVVHLDDDERAHLRQRLADLVGEALAVEPGPGRRPHTLAAVVVPGRPGEDR